MTSVSSHSAWSLQGQSGFLGDRRPERILVGNEPPDRGRVEVHSRKRKRLEMRAHLGRLVDTPDLGIELAYNDGREALRPGEPEPGLPARVGIALLGKGCGVRIGRMPR